MAEITFGLFFYGESWCDEAHTVDKCVTLSEADCNRMQQLTPDALLKYLRDNSVGKCNTISGTDAYFIPRLTFGNLEASLQVNYYLWSYRQDKASAKGYWRQEDCRQFHAPMISAEEFDAVVTSPTKTIDIAFFLDGREISMGQMTIEQVSAFLIGLANDDHPVIDNRP